uniref:MHC class I-like antigen recognition-like domain-containing protein n=1 Tax=Sus scrofa TaxID=9823 RepID=A0A8D0W2T1_PIG
MHHFLTKGAPNSFWSLVFTLNTHSLCYNFIIIPKPSSGHPWCVVQAQVDAEDFFSCDCGAAQIQSVSSLGEKVKGTKNWEIQIETLKDVGDFLKEQLPDIMPENYTAMDPPTLQVKVTCQSQDDGHTSGSWKFAFNGQICLHIDSDNMTLTVVHSGGRRMKEKWESDRIVTSFLRNISLGDCKSWLTHFLVHWEKMLKTAASPTTAPPIAHSKGAAIKPSAWFPLLVLVLAGLVPTVLLG